MLRSPKGYADVSKVIRRFLGHLHVRWSLFAAFDILYDSGAMAETIYGSLTAEIYGYPVCECGDGQDVLCSILVWPRSS
jgi:hypothetical protein